MFKLKHRFVCDSFNLIYVIICDTWKEEYNGDAGRKERQHIWKPQYQQQMSSQNINLRGSYEVRFQQKFKTKLDNL